MPHAETEHSDEQIILLDRTVAQSLPVQEDERTFTVLLQTQEAYRGARPPNFTEMLSDGYELHPAESLGQEQVIEATASAEAALIKERGGFGGKPAVSLWPEVPLEAQVASVATDLELHPPMGSLVQLHAEIKAMELRLHSRLEEVSGALSGLGIRLSRAPGAANTLPPISGPSAMAGGTPRSGASASGMAVSLDAKRRARASQGEGEDEPAGRLADPPSPSGRSSPRVGTPIPGESQVQPSLTGGSGLAWVLAAAAVILAAATVGGMARQLMGMSQRPSELVGAELIVRQTQAFGAYVREEQAALHQRSDGSRDLLVLERLSGIRASSQP